MSTNNPTESKPKARKWLRITAEISIFAALFLGFMYYQKMNLATGDAPDFAGQTLSGDIISLSDYQGKPVLLHFWASWCGICKMEEGSITSIHEKWPTVTVALQSGDDEEVKTYIKERGLTNWVTLNDTEGVLAQQYGVHGTPSSFVINPQGQIAYREVGYTSNWGLRFRLWLAQD